MKILLLPDQIKFELLSNVVIFKTSVVPDIVHQFVKHLLAIFSVHLPLSVFINLDLVSAEQLVIIQRHVDRVISREINHLHNFSLL